MTVSRTNRIAISNTVLRRLLLERSRTGMSWAAIIRYGKRIGVIRKECKLTSARVYQWEDGTASSALQSEIDGILAAYDSVRRLDEIDVPHVHQIIVMDETLRSEVVECLAPRQNSLRRATFHQNPPPEGLTPSLLTKLGNGERETIIYAHLQYIRHHLAANRLVDH